MKRVQITLELSESFVRLLNAKVGLRGGVMAERALAVDEVLSRAVLAEARGATEVQCALAIPPEWRSEIDVVHEARRVIEENAPKAEVALQ